MRRIVFLVCLFPLLAFAQPIHFTISGKLTKLERPTTVYLRYIDNAKQLPDSVITTDGSFFFKGKVSYPQKAFVTLKPDGATIPDILWFYIDKNIITITATDSLKTAVVKGGAENAAYQQINNSLREAYAKKTEANKVLLKIPPAERTPNVKDSISKMFEELTAQYRGIQKEFILKNPKSIFAIDVLSDFGGYAPEYNEVNGLFQGLAAEVRNSIPGQLYAAKLQKFKSTEIGAYAPNFTQNDTSGKPVTLSGFRGKYLLIDFWASWCRPCRMENPNVVKAYQKFSGRNFTILSISLDQPNGRASWLKAIADDHLNWNHVSDLLYWKNAVALLYGINAIPQNFLVDPSGKIIAKNIRGEELQRTLEKLLKEKTEGNMSPLTHS